MKSALPNKSRTLNSTNVLRKNSPFVLIFAEIASENIASSLHTTVRATMSTGNGKYHT